MTKTFTFKRIQTNLLMIMLCGVATPAMAQWAATDATTTPAAGQNYVVLGGMQQANSLVCSAPTGFCANAVGINLNAFSRASDVATQFAGVNAQFEALNAKTAKLFDLTATAISMRDAIPNAGDRFAVRLNMGGFEGRLAGSIGASANLDDSIRFSANYGQSSSESAFSAGMNFSFH